MADFYAPYIAKENEIFSALDDSAIPKGWNGDMDLLNSALDWLCAGAHDVLDFGCGTGSLLAACGARGVSGKLLGIDLAEQAVKLARKKTANFPNCQFLHGSVELLRALPEQSIDGMILSNILDNLRPEEAETVLFEAVRLLRVDGRLWIKLNGHLPEEQIARYSIQRLDGDLLDDGLLLWNRETEKWETDLRAHFETAAYQSLYLPDYEQYNRMFFCEKPIKGRQ